MSGKSELTQHVRWSEVVPVLTGGVPMSFVKPRQTLLNAPPYSHIPLAR